MIEDDGGLRTTDQEANVALYSFTVSRTTQYVSRLVTLGAIVLDFLTY